jgi:Glycosyl transferase family group 2
LELRRVSVVAAAAPAAADVSFETVAPPGPADGAREAPARRRRWQQDKRRRPGKRPLRDKRRRAEPRPKREAARPAPDSRPERAGAGHLVLPVPPLDSEKFAYVRRHTWVLTLCTVLTFPPLVYSQVRLFIASPWFLLYAPFMVLGTMTFFVSLLADGFGAGFDLAEHRTIVAGWRPDRYPSVDVFLPTCGEPVELLRNSWTHVAALRAAYRGRLTPYVLDDAGRSELKALARRFGFAYAARPDRGWYMKSGNLKYGFDISESEFILLLDADFAPRPDLLEETLPYFDAFADVGIVQTPQYFHVVDEQTWVERGAGAIQELFYRSIQTVRARKDGAICVGSCAVYRRAALDENDGMSLAQHSEDLHTGFDLYRLGWRLRYLPLALSTGNCPDNVMAFMNQQYRWCSGTMSLLRGGKFWSTRLPLHSRLCYLAGLAGYAYSAVFTFVAPALAIGMLVLTPDFLLLKNAVFVVPVLFYAGVVYPMWHRSPYRLEAWSVRVLSSWAHVFALWDMLTGRLRGWQPSGTGAKGRSDRRRLCTALICWSLGTAALWTGVAVWRMMTMDAYNFILTFVLGVFQLVVVGRILIAPRTEPATEPRIEPPAEPRAEPRAELRIEPRIELPS